MNKSEISEYYSMGDVVALTGISEHALRVWEKRYGAPVPKRLKSGHRRFEKDQVQWLLKVSEALTRGYRISKVISMPHEQLDSLISPDMQSPYVSDELIKSVLLWIKDFNDSSIRDFLDVQWKYNSPLVFVDHILSYLLERVGHEWYNGRMDVRHEHFFTNIAYQFLMIRFKEIRHDSDSRPVLLATLPKEGHSIGLWMAALTCAVSRKPTRILGESVPIDEMVLAVRETNAFSVGLTVSAAYNKASLTAHVNELREKLGIGISIILGGNREVPKQKLPSDTHYFRSCHDFHLWLSAQSV